MKNIFIKKTSKIFIIIFLTYNLWWNKRNVLLKWNIKVKIKLNNEINEMSYFCFQIDISHMNSFRIDNLSEN
jgi:hypothetical protein